MANTLIDADECATIASALKTEIEEAGADMSLTGPMRAARKALRTVCQNYLAMHADGSSGSAATEFLNALAALAPLSGLCR
jgi:hypothetical protein